MIMTDKFRATWQLVWPLALALVTIASAWGASRAETSALRYEVSRIDHQGSESLQNVRVEVAETRAQFSAILQRLDRIERKLDTP
jgi:hypothetical protein